MKFSLVTGGFPRDIEITFDQPISFILEDESYSSVELPDELPHCQGDYSNYTYPILEIESSKWSEQYSALSLAYNDCEPKQYALLSWYETVLVLSTDKPKVKLVNAYT